MLKSSTTKSEDFEFPNNKNGINFLKMEDLGFLFKLEKQGKLKLVEPSEEIMESYLVKANNSLKSAKVLLESSLYEDSVSMSYYVMYNSLIALLYKIGIKCENHSASIILLKVLFSEEVLYKEIHFAKEERIDKQYYLTGKDTFHVNNDLTEEMMESAEDFMIEMKLLIEKVGKDKINDYREKFSKIMKDTPKKLRYERRPGEIIKLLRKAYIERRKVKIQYYSLSSDQVRWRVVSIYQIGESFITAYCDLRDGERIFVIDRINAVAKLDEGYQIPRDWSSESIVNDK